MLKSSIARVRGLLFANLITVAIAAPVVAWSWWHVLAATVMYIFYNNIGIVIFNHRYLSHHSFEFKYRWLYYAFSFPALVSGTGSPLGWAALHSLHHKNSDSDSDPHQSARGWWRTIFIFYEADDKDLLRNAIANARSCYLLVTDRYWAAIQVAWIIALGLISFDLLYFFFVLPSAMTMLAQGATNYFGHRFGYRPHDTADNSRNNLLLALLNWGDGLHNNHHADPKSPSTRERWYEPDVAGAVIKAISK